MAVAMIARNVAAATLLASAAPAFTGAAPRADGCLLVQRGYGPAGTVRVRAARVATGLEVPWGIAFLPGGDALVTERPGRVRLLRAGALVPSPVATLAVAESGEGGLLGIAADPHFAENRRFYLYATVEKGGRAVNRVMRWVLAADGRSAREDRVLLDDVAAERFHDGGRIRFGPDGMLYVGTGDAGEPPSAQDARGPNGKILRIGTDGEVPRDNPTPGSAVFLRGLRNVEAFDWLDARTMVIADHGPSGELRRQGGDRVLVARAGENLGWPDAWRCEARSGMRPPPLAFVEAVPPGGGSIHRGDVVREWKGSFVFGTLRSRHLHRVVLDAGGRLVSHEAYFRGDPPEGLGRVREVVEGPDGALWVTTSNCDGRGTCPPEKDVIARIVPQGG
jgi:glucose/arabinose dehydrogenase